MIRIALNSWAVAGVLGITAAVSVSAVSLDIIRRMAEEGLEMVEAFNQGYTERLRGY